jgi:very-short-patch-repair endonuclease
LKETYKNVENQYKVEWCKNKKCLPFDYFLPDYKLIIEVDGRQHFRQVSKWNSPEFVQERDKFKMKCALEHGLSIIRINQEDIYYNKYDWKEKLKQYIKNYTKKNIIYISSDNCYDCFEKNNFFNFIPCKEQRLLDGSYP